MIELPSWHLEDAHDAPDNDVPPAPTSGVRLREESAGEYMLVRRKRPDPVEALLQAARGLMRAERWTAAQAVLIDELLRRPGQREVTTLLRAVRAQIGRVNDRARAR